MKKTIILFFTLAIALFSLTSIVSAVSNEVPEDVKKQVEADFENYKVSLNNDRENFGLSVEDDALSSVLGEGQPYYVVSKDFLDGNNAQLFTFSGYIFPINVGSKSAGIVFAVQQDGEWKVDSIKNDITLGQDIQNNISSFGKSNHFLVYDQSFRLVALTDGAESFMSLKNNNMMGINKNDAIGIKEIGEQIKAAYEINKQHTETKSGTGGPSIASENPKQTSSPIQQLTYIIIIGCAAGVLILFALIIQKNRKRE
ncbi:hypothetical protein [Paenibacillus sp. DMB20]|uniref:hypothetical protein n=1 Tax=Paenibacillus sp. DMB20 TaxID=1642570 RepID=UPI0006278A95|nr:hypothetical protein [Paenibacillus sp. DMB20]KKO52044.1 hypothetical protein XI25_21495 [Paenibacillus sp. DMB20]